MSVHTLVQAPERIHNQAHPTAQVRSPHPLRIGMVAPPWFDIPPKAYGGIEAVVADLVNALVARGNEVTLVASGPRRTAAQRQVRAFERAPFELLGHDPLPEVIQAAQAARAFAGLDLDIVHDHSMAGPLLARGRRIPTVITMHNAAFGTNADYFRRLGDTVDVVAISDAQRREAPALNWIGTVHNAIDASSYPFAERKDDYVLWIGRFCADKAPHLAIDAARRAGRRIVLAGKLNEAGEHAYFQKYIVPRLGPDVDYVGEADAALKRKLYAHARCLVFPIQWDEPFGMVMIEAMACGTPVVATPRGSVPEVVAHGRTGYIVDDLEQFPKAIERCSQIDPAACRRWVLEHFDLPVMARGYEAMYRRAMDRAAARRPRTVVRGLRAASMHPLRTPTIPAA